MIEVIQGLKGRLNPGSFVGSSEDKAAWIRYEG